MSTTVRELITKWGFEIEHDKLDQMEKQLEGIKGALEFLAAAEIVKGIYELTEKFAHFAEEMHIAAESAGITVEAFQKMSFAAQQSSISSEEMGMSMAKLARHLYEARRGSEQAQLAFAEAGFSPNQVAGFKNSQQALLALADRFKAIQDPIKKQALAMELLGRGSVHMVGFLSQGSGAIQGLGEDAERLGAILSGEQIEALVKVEHSMQKLWAVVKGFGATIASYFAPSIETAIDEFLKFYEVNKKLIDTNVKAWVWDITYAMGAVWAVVKFVTQAFFDFAKTHEVLTRRISEILVGLGAFVGALWVAQKAVGALKGGMELLGFAFKPIEIGGEMMLKPLLFFAGLAQKAIVAILLKLAVMAETAFPALSEALLGFGGILEATPVGWFLAAVAAIVVVVHDLWKLLTGGKWEDTWIYQAYGKIKDIGGKVLDFFGLGSDNGDQAAGQGGGKTTGFLDKITDVGGMVSKVTGIPGLGNAPAGGDNNNYSVNAPVTINVPSGTDPAMVGQKVKEGIKEHMDQLHRETNRSLKSTQAY